jgi:hypothetical protein
MAPCGAGYLGAMTKRWRAGTRVAWNTAQGETKGKVVRKLTSPCDIEGHHVAASEDEPQYLVESEKTGARAAHKPDALRAL